MGDPQDRVTGKKGSRRSHRPLWVMACAGLIVLPALLITGLWAYARWANSVPPFKPKLAPMPLENGYERTAALTAQLPREPYAQGPSGRWPDGNPDQLREVIRPARPTLNAVRAAFSLEWRAPPPTGLGGPSGEFARFRSCARYLVAESNLARREGNYAAALQRRLDGMELGCRMSRGGTLIGLMVGAACHAMGFARVERLVSRVPATAIPQALQRVRHIRHTWPTYPENLQVERLDSLASWTKVAQSYQQPTPIQTLDYLWDLAEKPLRLRKALQIPDDPVCRYSILDPQTIAGVEAKWWRPQLDLSLLEVALAVRMHRQGFGQYPERHSEISHRWLPAVPTDPWGQPIIYRLNSGVPSIYSKGPDGRDDGGRPADALRLDQSAKGDFVWGSLTRPRR
jgi:hypothetical protein